MAHYKRRTTGQQHPVFHIPDNAGLSRFREEDRDAIAYFLHLAGRSEFSWDGDENGGVPLKCEYIRNIISRRRWPSLRKVLSTHGLITCDHRYIVGEKSFSYRLLEPYRCQPTRPWKCTDPHIRRQLAKVRRQHEKRLAPVDRWLRANLLMLDFDMAEAKRVIASLTSPPPKPRRKTPPLSDRDYRALVRNSIARFDRRTGDFLKDKYGRRHSVITNLPGKLRHCVTVNNEQLVEIDVANSQPLFCGLVILKQIQRQSERSNRQSTTATIRPSNPQQPTTSKPPPTVTMADLPEGVTGRGFAGRVFGDLADYLGYSAGGRLYESLMGPGEDRKRFKRQMFADVYYGEDDYPSQLRDRFQSQFPTVFSHLQRIKRKDYRRAAQQMQRIEAKVVIDGACGLLMREHPHIPVVSVHDSLATIPRFVDVVHRAMMSSFATLGVEPTLEIKPFRDRSA